MDSWSWMTDRTGRTVERDERCHVMVEVRGDRAQVSVNRTWPDGYHGGGLIPSAKPVLSRVVRGMKHGLTMREALDALALSGGDEE